MLIKSLLLAKASGGKMQLIEAKSILVAFLMQLGDLVLTTPFLTVLRKAAPNAKIVYLIDEKWYDIVSKNPDVDEVITVDRKGRDNNFLALYRYTSKLRSFDFDYLININPSERCTFLSAFSGAKYKTGSTSPLFSMFFDKLIKLNRNMHAADMYIDVLTQLGAETTENQGLKIVASNENIQKADAFYYSENVKNTDKLIGFNVGSASMTKRWLPERFAEVADYVAENGYKPVFFGSTGELDIVNRIVEKMKSKSIIATGKLEIGALPPALKRLSVLITNDSGPMHVAISQSVPIVALYGPSKPELYGPYKANKALVVRAESLCTGCEKRMKHKCDDLKCMYNITTSQVLTAVDEMLKGDMS